MKQLSLAVAGSLAVSLSAFAGGTGPSYSHTGYNPDWSTGWYIGAGVNGDANMESDLHLLASTDTYKKDKNNVGFDVYVGRQATDHVSFELGYTWLGDQDFAALDTVADESATVKVQQWNVHGVGLLKWAIGDYFNVFGKAGVAYYQNQSKVKEYVASTGVETDSYTDALHTFAITYGAGAEVVWDQFGIRGEYNVVRPNDYDRDTFYISDVVSANVFYRFM